MLITDRTDQLMEEKDFKTLLKNPANVIFFVMAFLLGFSVDCNCFTLLYLALGGLNKWPYETIVIEILFHVGNYLHVICLASAPILFLLKIRKLITFLYSLVIYVVGALAGGIFLGVLGVIFDMNLMNNLFGL